MAPTTAQIMTENTVSQTYRATYSPDDNKLRLYASLRLDEETYSLINKAGFRWAPKQELFVAPAWTPGREDVLLSLAGDIEDEDSTLFDRQEQRAGRFSDYSDRRAVESEQALAHVDSLASAVPLGQPILVGHHSERRARRHAQKIENGMKRAVMLFERAEYWEQRAQASLQHAKYKERPDVRYRRIKKIEAELRKSQKHITRSEEYMTMWRAQTLDLKMALLVSNYDHIYACFTLDKYPRPAEKSQYEGSMSLHSALSEEIITFEQARDIAIRCHERTITRTVRRLKRQDFAFTRKMRREARQVEQSWLLRQNLLGQAVTELNFQSPETVCTWYTRWSDEFDAAELAAPFWRWQSRFTSLKELDWLRISGEPLYAVMYEIPLIVRETPEHIRVAERWQVPNKLADRSGV